jgi:protein phosphatase
MPTKIVPERSSSPRAASAGVNVDAGAWSRKGAARAANEDHYATSSLSIRARGAVPPLFLVVADGLGGEAAGQRASRIATASMVESLEALPVGTLGRTPEDALNNALLQAHLDVLNDASKNIWRSGMGTTLTAALVLWPRAHIVHAGDSRCYHVRSGALRQLTTDHTVAEILASSGQVSREVAGASRFRHVLWNHLGGESQLPMAQRVAIDLHPGDALLLATDGLTDALSEDEVAEIASRPCSAHAVTHMLVEAAAAHGTRDDATALFVRFGLPVS